MDKEFLNKAFDEKRKFVYGGVEVFVKARSSHIGNGKVKAVFKLSNGDIIQFVAD